MISASFWRLLRQAEPDQDRLVFTFGGDHLYNATDFTWETWESWSNQSWDRLCGRWLALVPYETFTGCGPLCEPWLARISDLDVYRLESKVVVADQLRGQLRLVPECSASQYLQQANEILEEIRSGRYYQLNFLRFFEVMGDRLDLLAQLTGSRAPFGCWIQRNGQSVVSFSPERFITGQRGGDGWRVVTSPIKGTLAAECDPKELLCSSKDRAELSMIIDLMRNDLHEISIPGQVVVSQAPHVQSFGYLHHLIGHVEALLPLQLRLLDFFRALLPAGSITGAPKIEVMQAIREREQRPRGFFMGNAFYFDFDRGYFDSSVLIRTVQHLGNRYEFAAGSGIVVKSIPQIELAEIATKCAVLRR